MTGRKKGRKEGRKLRSWKEVRKEEKNKALIKLRYKQPSEYYTNYKKQVYT